MANEKPMVMSKSIVDGRYAVAIVLPGEQGVPNHLSDRVLDEAAKAVREIADTLDSLPRQGPLVKAVLRPKET